MPKFHPIEGDTGEPTDLPDLPHCFIVRLDDDQFEAVRLHQARLARAMRTPVSRAAAVRELLGRALPHRKRRTTAADQLTLFSHHTPNDQDAR